MCHFSKIISENQIFIPSITLLWILIISRPYTSSVKWERTKEWAREMTSMGTRAANWRMSCAHSSSVWKK